jgi:hypothetical protein
MPVTYYRDIENSTIFAHTETFPARPRHYLSGYKMREGQPISHAIDGRNLLRRFYRRISPALAAERVPTLVAFVSKLP